MKTIYVVIFFIIIFFSWDTGRSQIEKLQPAAPQVKFLTPDEKTSYTWNEQVRYSISISDPKDGESKYGEIPSQECLLTLEYVPVNKEDEIKKAIEKKEEKALSLVKKSTCFGCHAQTTRVAGPSFQEIAARYETNEATINNLGDHILKGSIGVWGNQQMPAHPDFTEEQCRQIAKYILEIDNHPYRWVYPGLEGVFRVIDKPSIDREGVYVLTASYTSTSGAEGRHSIVLKIR
jgi:cytochrome c